MKKIIYIIVLFIPGIINSQRNTGISYQEGLDNCQKIIQENRKSNPDKFIYTGPECLIGAKIPEFSAMTMDGIAITSEYFTGKITILNFWIISCPPCIAEMPGFNNLIEKYGHDKFNYLAISLDDEKDIRGFLKNNPWGFSQIPSAMDLTIDIFNARWGYPTTFVINEHGVIIAAFSGGKPDESAVKAIEDKLSDIINEEIKFKEMSK